MVNMTVYRLIIRIANKAVSPALQLPIEFIEHEVTQQRRKRAPLRGSPAELVARNVSVIVAFGPPSAFAVKEATKMIPVSSPAASPAQWHCTRTATGAATRSGDGLRSRVLGRVLLHHQARR